MFSYLNPLPSLPQYTGPHKVSIADFEIPVSEIPSSCTAPNSQLSTIKFRIYYPTTSNVAKREPVYWLPNPQKQWNEAFASFLGADSRWAPVVSRLWSITNYIKLPVAKNGPLQRPKTGTHPVCFFSHGLGGNTNIYSSIVGSLASCGVVTIVPEHRDGSSPISFIRNAQGDIETTIPYQKLSHSPDPKVLNARNAQLRVRLWELELTYSVIKAMNEGTTFTNYAEDSKQPALDLKAQLNLLPGQVTWSGHSFGAATITQFVKSIFYHQHLPQQKESGKNEQEWDWRPLYQTQADSDLVKQITPESPVALLDIWTMPLRGETTSWLFERPMPCYSKGPNSNSKPSTVAMISGEFYRYEGILNRTRALLSKYPAQAIDTIESGTESKRQPLPPATAPTSNEVQPTSPSLNPIREISKQEIQSPSTNLQPNPMTSTSTASSRTPSPIPSIHDSPNSTTPTSSQSSLSPPTKQSPSDSNSTSTAPHLYHIPNSAHLSQSDFGPLFPNLTKYAMKALDPEKTIELNVRAILAVIRGRGLPAEGLVERNGKRDGEDYILDGDSDETGKAEVGSGVGGADAQVEIERRKKEKLRWVRVPLVEV